MAIETLYYRVISKDREFYHIPLYLVLRLVSAFYEALLNLRLSLYRLGVFKTRKLGVRVISVGNLTLGGTGKTPAVMMIAEMLRDKGFKPAILSRGYKGDNEDDIGIVSDGKNILLSAEAAGDEPLMMAERLKEVPVVQGRDRYRAGLLAAERFEVDTFILDDGFQHLALHRDLNILLCDRKNPFGNGVVFPAGDLREPVRQSGRADLIMLTRCSKEEGSETFTDFNNPSAPVIKTALRLDSLVRLDNGERIDPRSLERQPVAVFCGIVRPEDFFRTVEGAGAKLVMRENFPDHYRYTDQELKALEKNAEAAGARFLVTTEKDAVKLKGRKFSIPLLAAQVSFEIMEGAEILERLILRSPEPVAKS